WMKLRAAAATQDAYLDASSDGSHLQTQQQVVLFKCGHGLHRQCAPAAPECLQCAGRAAAGPRRDRADAV
ncbi:hypothetical protein H4R19_006802, partial [Coemansia spiralis]